jgi:hypothetical protein
MQALHSKVSMAMFCGEVAQRNIFILLRACGGRTERPWGAKQTGNSTSRQWSE